jgi:hypothetical protein
MTISFTKEDIDAATKDQLMDLAAELGIEDQIHYKDKKAKIKGAVTRAFNKLMKQDEEPAPPPAAPEIDSKTIQKVEEKKEEQGVHFIIEKPRSKRVVSDKDFTTMFDAAGIERNVLEQLIQDAWNKGRASLDHKGTTFIILKKL